MPQSPRLHHVWDRGYNVYFLKSSPHLRCLSWGGAELEVALSLVGSPRVMSVTGRKSSVSIYCCPRPSYTLLASREGASQMEVRDRWSWSGCQPSWIQAEPAVAESNAKNCGRTELWLHLVGRGVVWGPGLMLCLSSVTLEGAPLLPRPGLCCHDSPIHPTPYHLRTLTHTAPFTARQCHQQTVSFGKWLNLSEPWDQGFHLENLGLGAGQWKG